MEELRGALSCQVSLNVEGFLEKNPFRVKGSSMAACHKLGHTCLLWMAPITRFVGIIISGCETRGQTHNGGGLVELEGFRLASKVLIVEINE